MTDRFGTFRLLLKRTPDNRLLWAHFIQAPDGTTGMVMRGELRHPDELKQLQDTIHRTIGKSPGRNYVWKTPTILRLPPTGSPPTRTGITAWNFFCNAIDDNPVMLGPDESWHLSKVLRLRVGDAVATDGHGGFGTGK